MSPPGSDCGPGSAQGGSGRADAPSASGAKRVKPCCGEPFTEVNSPPTKTWVPSVASTRGPRPLPLGPPSVLGYHGPVLPSAVFQARRCRDKPRAQPTSGKASGSKVFAVQS